MEYIFSHVKGVRRVIPGYTGGDLENPTYEEVSTGKTGHFEAILIEFEESEISYERLLEKFWRSIDPTNPYGQFHDWGPQYRSAIFYYNESQKRLAEESKRRLTLSGIFRGEIVTLILPAGEFYPAEEYHREYYKKFPHRFFPYKKASGREEFVRSKWRRYPFFRLFPERKGYWKGYTPSEYYFDEKLPEYASFGDGEGIFVEKFSGEPLFSTFDIKGVTEDFIIFDNMLEEFSFNFKESMMIESKAGKLFLGYFEKNGTGVNFKVLINSLRFISRENLTRYGYVYYEKLFRR